MLRLTQVPLATALASALSLSGAAGCAASRDSTAPKEPKPPMPTPLDGFGDDLGALLSPVPLLEFGGGVLATGVLAFSGADHALRVEVQRSLVVPAYGDAAYWTGYLLPVTLAPTLWVVGLARHDRGLAGAGAAAVQALAVTAGTTALLKWATGRGYPLHGEPRGTPDTLDHPEYAHDFRFRPLQWNNAWPSGHTSSTISIAAALTAYYPESIAVPLIGYPVALAIGLGMVDGDRHWVSDVVGGALLGQAIGYEIGRQFRKRVRERDGAASGVEFRLLPEVGAGSAGVRVVGSF